MANGIGTKLYKENMDWDAYADEANWCNESGMGTIEDKGSYYEVVPIPQPSLDELKERKKTELKAERDHREVEPLQTSKGVFDYDDKSRDRLAIARQALMDNDSIPFLSWTTADNQRVTLTIADFAEINSMAAYRSNVLHIKYNELKIEVNDCKTAEEVEAITWGD